MKLLENLGRYKIIKELGRGSMGVVYKGYDPNIDRLVALKTIRNDLTQAGEEREEMLRRFYQEAKTAGKLSHQNVVSIFDTNEQEGTFYIVMEYIEGDTLERMLRRRYPFTFDDIISLMVQLLSGLEYAHKKGIIHRDIKPANIMITQDMQVRITDFGVAKLMSSGLTHTGSVMGTPSYMAPEMIAGGAIDNRVDIFSAGVVFYEMLTGDKPFKGESIHSIMYKIVYEEYLLASQLNPAIPNTCDFIVSKALAKSPASRYRTASDMALHIQILGEEDGAIQLGETKVITKVPEEDNMVSSSEVDSGSKPDQPTALLELEEVAIKNKVEAEERRLGTKPVSRPRVPSATAQETQHRNGLIVTFLMIAIIMISVLSVYWYFHKAPPSEGVLNLQSDPIGAEVYIDNILVGRTPLSNYKLFPGKHSLTLHRPGFKSYQKTVEIALNGVYEPSVVAMEPDMVGASLVVTSNVEGAMVWIGDRPLGTVPIEQPGLESGDFILKVIKDGYAPFEQTIKLETDKKLSLDVQLTPAKSSLVIHSKPTAATVQIDDKEVGVTPATIKNVDEGFRLVTVQKTDFQAYSEKLQFKAGESREITVELKPAANGLLTIQSDGPGELYVDGKKFGEIPLKKKKISAGAHILKFTRNGFAPVEQATEIKANEETTVRQEWTQKGEVSISVIPWGEIFIGGKSQGITPCTVSLGTGAYEIIIRHPTYGERKEPVRVLAGKTVHLSVDLTK